MLDPDMIGCFKCTLNDISDLSVSRPSCIWLIAWHTAVLRLLHVWHTLLSALGTEVCWLAFSGHSPTCQETVCTDFYRGNIFKQRLCIDTCCRAGSAERPARGSEGLSDKRLSLSSYQTKLAKS
jgi:hypothetical protein